MKKLLSATAGFLLFSFQISGVLASFRDVPSTYPQFKAIDALQMEKVINGYFDGTFKPDQLVTRGEFLKMVFNDVGYRPTAIVQKTHFIDVPAGNWTAPYVEKALEINAISANGPQPTFNPARFINRVDAIKIGFAIDGIAAPYYNDIDPQELFNDVNQNAWYAYLARATKLNGIIDSQHPELFWANHLMTRGDTAELIYQMEFARQANEGASASVTIGPATNTAYDPTSSLTSNPKYAILLDVWQKINSDYYNKTTNNQNDLIQGAIEGMVNKLGDQFTVYEDPTQATALQQYLQGQFDGVGMFLKITDDKKIIIYKTVPNSPAANANLQPGDIIVKINDQALDKLSLDDAINLIKGPAGSSINLTLERNGQNIIVSLVRAKITFSAVTGKMLNNIAYISIDEFTQSTPNDFTTTLSDLNKQSPRGYILDLRSNPGGYLESAIQILGHFTIKGTTVVSTKASDGSTQGLPSAGPGELAGKPLVVLVDGDSASAAEIMAGALQDLKLAKLVGVKTYGKGSVQEIANYPDNSLLKITIAHWLTPNGRDINGTGITPDIDVELDQAQLLKGIDTQLNKAVEVLNSQI